MAFNPQEILFKAFLKLLFRHIWYVYMFICLWQVTFLSEGWFNNRFLKEYFQIFSKTLILTSSEDINALFCCTNLIFVSFYFNKNELQLMQLQLLY